MDIGKVKMKIEFNRLDLQYKKYQSKLDEAALRVLGSNQYILGSELQNFEKSFAEYTDTQHCIGVNSGTDALILALRVLGIGPGDEVIVPANTYIATVIAVTENRATPIFVEPNDYYLIDPKLIEAAITPNTKAIIPVHLYGQSCDMDPINEIAKKYNLFVIEDCAQSHGALYKGKKTGSFGDIGCFSFYPTKNLGAFGDGGAVVTDNADTAEKLRMMRNFGSRKKYHHETEGINSRLDEMQAALLSVKLKHLDEMNKKRNEIADYYLKNIDNKAIKLPEIAKYGTHVFHLFVIQIHPRELFQNYLSKHEIGTMIHYPIPPYKEARYSKFNNLNTILKRTENESKNILSLPLYIGLSKSDLDYVIEVINKYDRK